MWIENCVDLLHKINSNCDSKGHDWLLGEVITPIFYLIG